ncbi:MAG: hypothetical protein V1835_02435 [Candidatus Micrarchaeota archaeon]
MGSPDFLVPWVLLGIWFALFNWLGTGTMLEKWGKKKGFDKLIKKESSKLFMLQALNAFVEAFFIYLIFIMTAMVGLYNSYSFWLFYALLGVVVQIPVRVGMALTMNLPERFLLGDMVGGIFKYVVGGWILLQFPVAF